MKQLQQAAIRAGEALNARRRGRGMKPRPVRALMLGFPNVGKSALINRLVRQKVVESARKAGVTRSLRWVRLGQDLDLLDAPGVLPRLDDQQAALRLALCDDIGQAAYDTEAVALAFIRLLVALGALAAAGVEPGLLETRYGLALAPLLAADAIAAARDGGSGRPAFRPGLLRRRPWSPHRMLKPGWRRRRPATRVAIRCGWPSACSMISAAPCLGPSPWSCPAERPSGTHRPGDQHREHQDGEQHLQGHEQLGGSGDRHFAGGPIGGVHVE